VVAPDVAVAKAASIGGAADFCVSRGVAGFYVFTPDEAALLGRLYPHRSLEDALVASEWPLSGVRPWISGVGVDGLMAVSLAVTVELNDERERVVLLDPDQVPTSVVYCDEAPDAHRQMMLERGEPLDCDLIGAELLVARVDWEVRH